MKRMRLAGSFVRGPCTPSRCRICVLRYVNSQSCAAHMQTPLSSHKTLAHTGKTLVDTGKAELKRMYLAGSFTPSRCKICVLR